MTEKQKINGKEVWIQVNTHHMDRANPNIIPTEYFTACYFFRDPATHSEQGREVCDEEGKLKLFESPVEALSFARKLMEKRV